MGKLSAQEVAELAQRAKAIRRHIVSMVTEAQSGHPGGSLSAADILTLLYFKVMNIDAAKADDAERKMLVGLAHDRIIHLGMVYIERGYVTQDEYENLNDYLYAPYEKMGGNGSAKRVIEEVRRLPIRKGEPA